MVYAATVWALPVFMLPFVNILPFVHERGVVDRLFFSMAGSALLVAVLLGLNGGRPPKEASVGGTTRQKVLHWIGVISGLAMFTYSGAALSPNLFGITTKLLPQQTYTARVSIDSAEYYGSRYKSVALEYRDDITREPRHLVISKRLFDYPHLKSGDVVELRGRRTVLGDYVDGLSLRQRANRSIDADVLSAGSARLLAAGHLRR
ncbi:hypothetical protein PE066_17785 [Ramlibacter tataouinensis]|uniref:hypothetical protein n=1 Tax=Ramlibacter tataouinensis TaxID=94132 RepID=UPI0022F3FD64|nr:hypothetical protein [Ramlibacter tataouinensis]WBY01293.1 hypothetical protein PE066_17785 [Ramlibacter tataouinensis]